MLFLVKYQTYPVPHKSKNQKRTFFSASILSVGQICGSLLTALISDEFGRKAIATSSCLPALIGWLCIGLAYNKACLLAGRFFVRILCTHYCTVWKIQDFCITQILREINFVDSRNVKTAIFAIFRGCRFCSFGKLQP